MNVAFVVDSESLTALTDRCGRYRENVTNLC
jgi:hypothetical protein